MQKVGQTSENDLQKTFVLNERVPTPLVAGYMGAHETVDSWSNHVLQEFSLKTLLVTVGFCCKAVNFCYPRAVWPHREKKE